MKNKLPLTIFFLLVLVCTVSFAQTYTLYGDKSYGSVNHDHVPSVVYLNDGSFLISSYSFGTVSGDKTVPSCDTIFTPSDIWFLKIDTAFNIIWNKCYGGMNAEYQPYIIKTQKPDRFIITSTSNSDSTCQKTSNNKSTSISYSDYWVLSIDTNGNTINDWSWGGLTDERYAQTIELNSGNFIICGTSNSPVSGDKSVAPYDSTGTSDYWIVKTGSVGNKLWDKVYGGTGKEYDNLGTYLNAFKVLADTNDAFVLAGTTDSPLSGDISDSSRGLKDIWIIKIDSAGNKIWDKRYGGSGNEQCNYIMHTAENGYMVCGSTASPQGGDVSDTTKGNTDCWIIKLDSMGNKQWDKRYGGNKNEDATWIEKAPDGGYWVSGWSASDSSGDVTQPRYGTTVFGDYWIFKINDAGNKIWDQRFGGPGLNYGSTFIIMPDSSIFLFGASFPGINAVKTDYGKGQQDIWIVHFKYTCTSTATINATACNGYTSPSGNYNWTVSGIYTDTLTNVTGCDSVITVNLTINNATNSTQNIAACYSYTSPSGNYNWTASGVYADTLINATGCDSVITVNLTINVVDTSVTANAPYLSSNATSAAYQWMYCDSSLIAGATNQSYTATANGWYAVMVVQNGCEDTSACYLVLNVGVDENENEDLLNIYPNPTDDAVTITSAIKPIKSMELTNVMGQTLYKQTINKKSTQLHLDNYPKGFYFIKITGENYIVVKKIMRL